MIPIPAIDLKGGKVVRLLHGDFKEERVYFEDPLEVALRFKEQGAARLHVVDLDGALKGEPKNLPEIERVILKGGLPVEVGGGVRSLDVAARYFDMGARWAVLGTKACLDKGFLREAVREFGTKIILGIDARDGFVATDGWTNVTRIRAAALCAEAKAVGASTVVYTDISRDGALKGPNLAGLAEFADAAGLEVIASGGVSSLADVRAILALKRPNVSGVIIGKALYENRLDLSEAVKACSQNESSPA
jgi:phosphoribosylformimino-5-aminoimidazole carboxamide ribotide isomerase